MSAHYLEPTLDALPAELRLLPYVLWRPERVADGRVTKVPYRIAEPICRASTTNPATWGTLDEALATYTTWRGQPPLDADRGPVVGIGVVLVQERNVTCLDLDHVIDERGELDPRAAILVQRAGSWTEISPSGTGLHVFVLGAVPQAIKGAHLEIYSTARFICLTGHHWPGTPLEVRGAQDLLDELWGKARANLPRRTPYTGPRTPPPDDLAGALLAKLERWGLPAQRVKRWSDGYLVELEACPWAGEHTTGAGGAAVIIHGSGALDFTCLHAHCAGRTWRDFRAHMEARR